MNPKDREMMEQIFNDVEPPEMEADETTELEVQKLEFAMHMIASFAEVIEERISEGDYFYLAPPTNFSYLVN